MDRAILGLIEMGYSLEEIKVGWDFEGYFYSR